MLNLIKRKDSTAFQITCNLFLPLRTLPPTVTEWNQSISPPHATYFPITGPSPHMGQLLDSSTWHQQQLIHLAAIITPPTHSGLFHSWKEQFPPQEYLRELRILQLQRDLCNYQAVYLFKKVNYYFLFYNNCICFKSVYVHDKVICFSAGFSYSVLM